MQIQHRDDSKKGVFFISNDADMLAEMTYVWAGANLIIDHTEVTDVLNGKGIGKQLVHCAVEMAREKNIKIIPLCPFAKAIFDRVNEYQDVLFKNL